MHTPGGLNLPYSGKFLRQYFHGFRSWPNIRENKIRKLGIIVLSFCMVSQHPRKIYPWIVIFGAIRKTFVSWKFPAIRYEISPLTSIETISILRDLFSRYSLPMQLVSKDEPQFTSAEFKEFLKRNGIMHIHTPYHPALKASASSRLSMQRQWENMPDEVKHQRHHLGSKFYCPMSSNIKRHHLGSKFDTCLGRRNSGDLKIFSTCNA